MFDGISTVAPPICAVISGTSGKNALPSIDGAKSAHGTTSRESTTETLTISCLVDWLVPFQTGFPPALFQALAGRTT